MKKMIKWPSIEQFRTVVANVNRSVGYIGLDENGDAIYDHSVSKPKLKFKGTVKLHGTNAGVCFNQVSGMWCQSRENIITPEKDNAGFAFFAESNRERFLDLFTVIALKHNIDIKTNTISIYGEWCGASIQKNVGITNLEKSFFIFGVKVSPFEIEGAEKQPTAYFIDHSDLRSNDNKIYNIEDYQTYELEIDFNVPQLVQNKIIELTIAVEDECPVAKAFGFPNTIGEGIVWSCEVNGTVHRWKSKGEKHAGKSKVKTLNKVDDEKIRKVLAVAEQVTPTWRLAQMLAEACDTINGGTLDRSKLGTYIKLVINDIIKEDSDVLTENGVEPKDIGKYVSEIARRYFFDQELV